MRTFIGVVVLLASFFLSGCVKKADGGPTTETAPAASDGARANTRSIDDSSQKNSELTSVDPTNTEPRTIREFFMLLPEKYFVLEGCDREKDKECKKAKLEYLKTFTEIEDTANGYLKGGCDGGQSCIEMTIFRKPDSTYLVAISTEGEMIIEQYFLDYAGGGWTDVAAAVIPQFSKKNFYELPRQGTTVKVFAKKIIEQGDNYEIAEKGAKLYDLTWKDGKFTIKK